MPQLKWDELSFLEYLEIEPVVEDYETSHCYEIVNDGLRLQVKVWQFESVVGLCLSRENNQEPIIDFVCFVRGEIRCLSDKRGEFIEFNDCILAPNRFWYQSVGDIFDQERFPAGQTVKLQVKPDISIVFDRSGF